MRAPELICFINKMKWKLIVVVSSILLLMACASTSKITGQKEHPSNRICNTYASNVLVLNNDQFELIYKDCTAVIENGFVPSTEKS